MRYLLARHTTYWQTYENDNRTVLMGALGVMVQASSYYKAVVLLANELGVNDESDHH